MKVTDRWRIVLDACNLDFARSRRSFSFQELIMALLPPRIGSAEIEIDGYN
jgi:hypothetical protein